jgi:hypothetical protein
MRECKQLLLLQNCDDRERTIAKISKMEQQQTTDSANEICGKTISNNNESTSFHSANTPSIPEYG